MLYYSTNRLAAKVDLRSAVLQSLAPDNGLYMPETIPKFPQKLLKEIDQLSFGELSFEIAKLLVGNNIPVNDLRNIVFDSINFEAPLVYLDNNLASLELWHGPSMAFKDYGVRFLSRLLVFFLSGETKEQVVLVATSGDTGGAVAAGFHNTPGIRAIILYPSGGVTHFQKKQITAFGGNITAIEVEGSFDDCQDMVKSAFLDKDVNKSLRLSSANSINIARLVAQTFYFFEAYKQIKDKRKPIIFSIPSGNFGNLTSGLIAKKMGLPVNSFVAATNINKVVPDYLRTGHYAPATPIKTLSNAMDVGNPSNFVRILELYGSTWNYISKDIIGFWLDDEKTLQAINNCYEKYGYIIDPHGAIAYSGVEPFDACFTKIFLATAHPFKFLSVIESTLNIKLPASLDVLNTLQKTGKVFKMNPTFIELKSFLLDL